MTGHGTKFGRKMELAIAALIGHRTLEEAAKAAGISVATLKRWMKLAEFKAAYQQARKEVVNQANARIQQSAAAAAAVLSKLMADSTTPASVRTRAAVCILERANRSVEMEDLEVRLQRLEIAQKREEK